MSMPLAGMREPPAPRVARGRVRRALLLLMPHMAYAKRADASELRETRETGGADPWCGPDLTTSVVLLSIL